MNELDNLDLPTSLYLWRTKITTAYLRHLFLGELNFDMVAGISCHDLSIPKFRAMRMTSGNKLVRQRRKQKKIIIAVHGIRTHAEWSTRIAALFINTTDYEYWQLSYWPFDVIDLFSPLPFWRIRQKKLLDLIMEAKQKSPHVSVVAHSFGTYLTLSVLKDNPALILDKLLLCGSILKAEHLTPTIRRQVHYSIINDCGTRDIWPCIAELCSKTYGSTGVRGFGAPVNDRYYNFGHSGFFKEGFAESYWIPIFQELPLEGKLLQGEIIDRQYSSHIQLLMWTSSIRKKLSVFASAVLVFFAALYYFWNICFFSNCATSMNVKRSASFAEATCVGGRRLYSNFIQDELKFNTFLKNYEARWFFTRKSDGRPSEAPPMVRDLHSSESPIVSNDFSHVPIPYYSYNVNVSWLRKALLQWDFRDVYDEPGGVGYVGRFPISDIEFSIRLPNGKEIEKCDGCENQIDGISIGDANSVWKEKVSRSCVISNNGKKVICHSIDVPKDTRISYLFNIKGWNDCN